MDYKQKSPLESWIDITIKSLVYDITIIAANPTKNGNVYQDKLYWRYHGELFAFMQQKLQINSCKLVTPAEVIAELDKLFLIENVGERVLVLKSGEYTWTNLKLMLDCRLLHITTLYGKTDDDFFEDKALLFNIPLRRGSKKAAEVLKEYGIE